MVSRSVEVDMKLDSLKNCIDELYERFDQIDVELKRLNESLNRLDNTLTSMSYSDEKVLAVESYFGVITQRLNRIESYRDFKEKRYKQIKEKIFEIIAVLIFASGCFLLGVVSGGIQWKWEL